MKLSAAFQDAGEFRLHDVFPVDALVFVFGTVGYTYLVEQRLHGDLVQLQSEVPRVVAQQQAGDFLVGEHGDAVSVLPVCLALGLGYHVLPAVEEVRAPRAVGDDHVGMVRLHGLEFLVGVGEGISPVGLDVVLPEAVAAAVAAFGIVDDAAAPGLHHAAQHVGVLGSSYSLRGEHLGIVAAYVFDDLQRFAGLPVDEAVGGLFRDEVPVLVYQVACVCDVSGFLEFPAAGFPEQLAYLRLELGELVPGFEYLDVVAERGDAGGHIVFVARLGHQGELPCDYRHRGLLGDGVAVVGDAPAGRVARGFVEIPAEHAPAYLEEHPFRSREEILPDAAPHIEPVVIGNLFLVVGPYFLFALVYHILCVFLFVVEVARRVLLEGYPLVFVHADAHLLGLHPGVALDRFDPFGPSGDVEDAFQLVEGFLGDFPQHSRAFALVIGAEALHVVPEVFRMPFPYRSGLDVVLPAESFGVYAVAVFQDVAGQHSCEGEQLASLFGTGEVPELGRKVPERHYDQAGAVLAGASRHAGHAFSAVPDGVAFQQFLYFSLVLALDGVHYLARVVAVELGRRADGGAGPAVDAGLQPFLDPVVLGQFVVEFTHNPNESVALCACGKTYKFRIIFSDISIGRRKMVRKEGKSRESARASGSFHGSAGSAASVCSSIEYRQLSFLHLKRLSGVQYNPNNV